MAIQEILEIITTPPMMVEIETTTSEVVEVTSGPPGPAGPTGPQGPAGGSLWFGHVQVEPSNTWVVDHNLGTVSNVMILDAEGREVEADVTWTSNSRTVIQFSSPQSGNAIFS